MTTPPAQNVPVDFQDEIDIPGPDLERNKRLEALAKANLALANREVADLTSRLAAAKARPKPKKPTAAQSAAATFQIKAMEKRLADARGRAANAQNRIHEARGEYDKLLTGANRDAFAALRSMFDQFGLGSLAGKIYEYVKQGYGADTIGILLQDTKEYKERFAANEQRAKAGLAVLSPAEYLAAEAAYRQILSSAGMPKGFYDNAADFRGWIAGDVSPTEIKGRVDLAMDAVNRTDPTYRAALQQMYGVNSSDLAAYFLDRKLAEPVLKKQAAASAIGAAALRRGFSLNRLDLEEYADLGLTPQEAEQAYGQISGGFEAMLGIANRYGTGWSQKEAEQEVFKPGAAGSIGAESAAEKGRRLRSQERAAFSGGRASSSQGLNAGYRQT